MGITFGDWPGPKTWPARLLLRELPALTSRLFRLRLLALGLVHSLGASWGVGKPYAGRSL